MDAKQILQQYFDFPDFRPLQREIVDAILSGRDTLALLPTGGGKSICYQVPGLIFFQTGKVTLVISTLIALMKDQVDHLHQKNISATFINHTLSTVEQRQRLTRIKEKQYA